MIICGRDFSPALIERLNQRRDDLSRRALSRELCQWLDWKGPSGQWQTTNGRIAIRKLERCGLVKLPTRVSPFAGKNKTKPVPPRPGPLPPISGSLAQIGPVQLILVGHRHSQAGRQCRQLLESFHPLGARLCGSQLRYLIRCSQGIAGVVCFSAAARRLRARDEWIGWSDIVRAENLHRIVLRAFDKGILVRDAVEKRIEFVKWDDITKISRLAVIPPIQPLSCSWFRINCPDFPIPIP